MHEVEQYVIHPQERHGDLLSVTHIQQQLQGETVAHLASSHLWLDEYIEREYGKDRRVQHEQEAYLIEKYGILEGEVMSLRLPQGTMYTLNHHNPCYWYIPEGNSHLAMLALGQERPNTRGGTRVTWQTLRPVNPHELLIIPPHVVHAFVNPGDTTWYASLVTQARTAPPAYRLTLRDKLFISQPQHQPRSHATTYK